MDKLSYALGLSMAQNFKGSGIASINADDFADALRAVYEDKEKKMTYDEAKKVVQDFFTELEANAGAMNEELGKKLREANLVVIKEGEPLPYWKDKTHITPANLGFTYYFYSA